ncbi:uncharacterized protein UTRI_04661 [Ustilago trichophora]|uniref:Uncharacterized protein n=1 Tax=Ustilago trichophora TaxID=86804 RepID=A0A5C3EDU8_9BASI|nr:uncharacterized protein UTRI_04661 [Ustilago trichophora]
MVQIQNIAAAAVIGAASYAVASPVETPEVLEARTFGLLQRIFEKKAWLWNCIAPWHHASLPSWSWGCDVPGIPGWNGGDKGKCWLIWNKFTPYCKHGNQPKPIPEGCNPPNNGGGEPICKDGYQQVFKNYQTVATSGVYQGKTVGAATIDNANYLTYILVDGVDKCLKACDQTKDCVFVNLYQDNADKPEDVNELPESAQAKYKKGNLTCALYKACSGPSQATNYGGQQDPTYITDSNGYCKGGKC